MCKTNTRKRIALLLTVFLAVAVFAAPAEASGVPSKIIVFTDKKVYQAWWDDTVSQSDHTYDFSIYDADFGDVYVYAVVLDDDGKIMKGRSITGNLYDTIEYDHDDKGVDTYHHGNLADPNLYDRTLVFNDTGTFGDGVASDGIYTAKTTLDKNALGLSVGNTREENHIKLRAYANDTAGSLSAYTESLISFVACMNAPGDTHPGTHVQDGDTVDNCPVCHVGYEHFYENKSGTFADSQLDIHALKWNPPDTSICDKGFEAYIWNRTYLGPSTTGCVETAEQIVPGSKYCYACHTLGTALYDYDNNAASSGATTRVNVSDKPSCNNANCHSTTDIEAATIIPWTQAAAPSGAGQNSSNIWKQKSHNHSTTSQANVSCALCHLTQHGFTRPSNSTTNMTQICLTCHNRSDGWINVSKNVSHTSTGDCKNCHLDNNKLDSHLVPTGVFGGKWCMDCHKILGKSPIDMDENVTNVSNTNYIHYALNNKSAGTTNSSRICWGCHTNDSVVINGIVNSTMLPASTHPDKYDQPRNCTGCHNNSNANLNFSAPQTYRHTWYASNMKTSAVTYCTNCHGQSEMALSYNQSATAPSTDNESTSHYGRVRTDLEEKIGTREYCGYCHQNETTVMGPFANADNEVRSDHASQATTPGCGNNTCHKPGRMHENTLIVPAFTEANIGTTCQACHSSGSYSSHNSTITCWDCHMGNVSSTSATWVHPIQFIQYNGNFTGAKLTGATCYDCHKSTSVDSTITNLSGKSPPKVYNQAHSSDPNNGTKWGDYWKYTPTTYEFASYEILGGNGSIDPAHPFANIQVPSNDYMQLNETQTGRSFQDVFPIGQNDREFINSIGNWTGVVVSGSIISGNYDAQEGNSSGSIYVERASASTDEEYNWTSGKFYYNGSADAGYTYANFSVEKKVTASEDGMITNVVLIRPVSGNVTIYSGTYSTTDASFVKVENTDISSYLTDNGNYSIRIYTKVDHVSGGNTAAKIYYDNVKIMIKEKVWNRYEIIINTTGVPVNGSSKLGMSYQVHRENTSLMVYNKTSSAYETLDTLDKGVFYDYTKNISTHHINSTNGITGNVSVKFVDDDQNDNDATTDAMHIRYLYIYTDRGLQYPCEQCHSPNKHYLNPSIGSPDTFKGSNKYNTTDLTNSTWCQQCHYQGASNYSGMINEFNVTRNPPENIPPEITGNTTYAPLAKPGYVNHTGSSYSNMNDSGCFSCHGKTGDTASAQFVHNVQIGTSGNRQCITCHNTSASNTKYKKIEVSAVKRGMHANLKNASANVSNASDPIELACWACHGDGTYNSSDQHRNANAWTCDKCHTNTTGKLSYSSATKVYEHIPAGFITPEANITANSTASWSCADCHNNSINTTALVNDNEADSTNARTGHYGLNRTSGKLMYDYSAPPKGNSEDCVYCHKGNSANMTKWGINTSTTRNLSNKASHSSYTNSQCGGCHNYTNSSTFTFHAVEINAGAGSGPDCKSCHDTSVSGTDKGHINYTAFNASIHGGINTTSGANNNPDNEPCWACHGSGQSEGHNTTGDAYGKGNYTNPYVCADCHVSTGVRYAWATGKGALNVSEHFTNGTDIRASYNSTASFSCLKCHQDIGEMLLYNNDTDYNKTAWASGGDKYNGIIGGNNSPYHYGAKRPALNGSSQGTDGYCNYCHNNASSAFPYVSQHNRSIFEHTNTTNTSVDVRNNTLTCANSICHSTGRIHNGTLNKPAQTNWTSGKYDYCAPCHKSTGNANKKVYNQWHDPINSSSDNITNCNYCHDSGSLGNTTLSYNLNVHSDNLTYPANAVNCTACHNVSSTYVKSRKILTHFPNASKDKGNTTLSARTCEACHGIAGQSMHASGLVKKPAYNCADCHVSTSAGPYWANQSFNTYIDTTSHDNSTTSNVTNCVWCHNNTNRIEAFHFTSYANGSAVNPGWGGWQAGKPVNCTDCHDSSYSNQAPFYAPAKPHAGTGNNTDECYSCHTSVNNYAAAPLAVHTVIQAPGNANCTKCHDIGGAASKEVDVAAMNTTNSIHVNLNSGAANSNATAPYATDSKRCWACHGDGSDKNEHDQVRYKNPYKCEDCHTSGGSQSGKYQSFNVSEHFAGGADIRAPGAAYCYDCHNKSEMLKQNNDVAISSSNASVGHYGKKRVLDGNDYPQQDTIAYCNKCHNNGTSVFPFIDTANQTIANHSINYNSTNPSCLNSSCHATGRIHNATLVMPELVLPNSTYCTACHNNKEKHNSTGPNTGINCTECHLNSSKSIHPARYLEYTSTWSTSNSSAVNCTSCHQGSGLGGFGKARIIPAPANHSTHNWSGRLWGNYWNNNSQQDSCRYCHGNISYHNASGLGLVLSVKGNNTVRMNFSGLWCANCHYNKAPNYSVGAFTPAPPEVTTQTTPNDASVTWYNHSSDLSSNYTDAKCKECHNNALDSGATSLNFTHNLAPGGGGPDCVACHDTGKGNAMVDVNAIKASMHWNLKNASAGDTTGNPANKICWACHQSDGMQPQGHPDRKLNPYNCTDCHKNTSRPSYVSSALQVANHYKSGSNITALVTSSTNDTSCTDCHLLSEMVVSYTEPDAEWNNNSLASHYGKNRSDIVAMDNNSYCNYCHSNSSTAFAFNKSHNKVIFEHTINSTADIRNATTLDCIDCHTTNPQSYRIHNSTLKTPSANAWTAGKEDRCVPCHRAAGSGSSLKVNSSYHNTTGSITDCGYCHNSDAIKAGNAPQNIHSDNLTAGGNSTFNNCYNCHQNGFASKVIKEHTNSSTGANITNTSMTCDKSGCHYGNKTHSNALVKPVTTIWTAGGNDYCAPCHNSSDSTTNATKKIYNKGHDPANRTNDNITSCGNCHNASTPGGIPSSFKLHDSSLTNLSGSNDLTCEGCHNATTAYVGIAKQILSHMPNASQYRGNTSMSGYTCKYCHNMTNKPSMHSAGMTRSNGTCETCHLNNTSPFKSSTKNLTQMAGMLNHSYNGSANTTCKMCHNASGVAKGFHLDQYAASVIADPERINSAWSNRNLYGFTNLPYVDCIDCHEKFNDTAPFNAPFFEANKTGVNNQEHVGKGYTINNCFVCHTYEDNVSKRITVHNVSIEPLTGGPNCTKCHNIGATASGKAPDNMLVNFTAFNNTNSTHRNLTNVTAWGGSTVFGLIDTACWACHQSDGKQPERHPDKKDEAYKAYRCAECHTVGGNVSTYQPKIYQNATKVYKHYPGAVFSGSKVFPNAINCSMCHKNSKVAGINLSAYSDNIDAMATNISHYATRTDLIDTRNKTGTEYGCNQCHGGGAGGGGESGQDYGSAINISYNHNTMGGSPASCQKSCHNSNPGVNITLHNSTMGINIGTSGCYSSGCHTAPSSGGRRKR